MDLAMQVQMMGAVVDVLVQAMPDEVFAAEAARRGMLTPNADEVLESVSSGDLWTEVTRRRAAGDELLVEMLPSESASLRGTSSVKLWGEIQIRLRDGIGINHDLLWDTLDLLWDTLDLSKIDAREVLAKVDLSKVPAQEVLAKVSDREKAKWAEANLEKLDGAKWATWAADNLEDLDPDVMTEWVERNFDVIDKRKLVEWANDNVDRLDEDMLIQWAEDNLDSLSNHALLEWATENYEEVLGELDADAMQSVLERQEDDDLWSAIDDKAKYRKLDFSCLSRDEAAAKAKELVDYLARES